MTATKTELRQEIAELRRIGGQMANICFNLAQRQVIDPCDRQTMHRVREEWDAIKRSERNA